MTTTIPAIIIPAMIKALKGTNISNSEWSAFRTTLGLRESNVSHFWGHMPPEFEEGKDLPFTVDGDAVTFVNTSRYSNGKSFPAVEFRYWAE
jgi:hypothetical protein